MANVPTLHNAADLTQSQAAGGISQLVPTGSVLTFAGSAAPTGWLVCDGASLSTTAYASLFAVIGYTFGGSGGSFNLPDLRGRFVRYDDNMGNHGIAGVTATAAANRDSGRGHGSTQADTTKRPTTAFTTAGVTASGSTNQSDRPVYANNGNKPNQAFSTFSASGYSAGDNIDNVTAHVHSFNVNIPASTVNGGGDAETRPINIALNAIIKI